MGSYRFLLAFCVLYSHVFGSIKEWNIGVVAVISFFIISGYVMTILIHKYYRNFSDIPAFYLDRGIRLFPQYLFYITLTILGIAFWGLQNDSYWKDLDAFNVLINITLLPTGYYMFLLENTLHLYIPPAWSLGLEATFYLIIPIFLIVNKSLRYLILSISTLIFLLSVFGKIHSAWFGYHLLPGTFYIFIIGMTLADPKLINKNFPLIAVICSSIALLVVLFVPQLYALPYNKEVITGVIVGTLAITHLKKLKLSKTDELMGNLSYGVFLNHWLIMIIFEEFSLSKIGIPFISIALAALSYYLVEKPVVLLRRRIRQKRCTNLQSTAAPQ